MKCERSSDPIGAQPRGGWLAGRGIDCCDAALFASGVADEPFESGHVSYPEVATLTV